MKLATAVVALAALRANATAAPLGSPAYPIAPLALAAAPIFTVPSDHGLNGPALDDPALLLPGLATAILETPSGQSSGSFPLFRGAVLPGVTVAMLSVAFFFGKRTLRRRSRRQRRKGYPQRTMAFI